MNPQESLLKPAEHVLSTLEKDGTRRWISPKLSKGDLLMRRRIVAYFLIAVFTLVPFLKMGGKPLVLLDVTAREFTIFGFTFLPTDTVLLAMFLVGVLLAVFLLTALFGRVWCGWACPQTVYMEFLYRPIERFFDGTNGRGGKPKKPVAVWRTVAKYAVYLLISIYLANTFLAYFIGVEKLSLWVTQSPIQNPVPFLIMAAVTAAMMFDFCYFREQMCIIACPYGRLQSVLLDQNSIIVSYDHNRGEPRGKAKKKVQSDLPVLGDCVDCGNCVTTCPTGIDIRQGLQMECINCTQCIDACNTVMKKLDRPPNLIRFSSQANDRGASAGLLRARTIIYPLLLAGIASAFLFVLFTKSNFDASLHRETGNPFVLTEDDEIRNLLTLKLTNRTDHPMSFLLDVMEPANSIVSFGEDSLNLQARQTFSFHISIVTQRKDFKAGKVLLKLRLENEQGHQKIINFNLRGPFKKS